MDLSPPDSRLDLGIPAETRIEADVALELLERLIPWAGRFRYREIRRLAESVVFERLPRTYEIRVGLGPDAAWVVGPHYALRAEYLYALRCDTCSGRVSCPHVPAALLALAWVKPALRKELEQSAWRRRLAPLLGSTEPPEATPDDRPRGWIRVSLPDPRTGEVAGREVIPEILGLLLVPTSKRSGKALKPRKAPRSLAAVESKVRDLPEADRAICRLAEQRQLLDHLSRYRYSDSVTVQEEIDRLDADLFARLGDASEVWFGDRKVSASDAPWEPVMTVTDGAGGDLALGWDSTPLAVFEIGPGYVIDRSFCLRPLSDGTPKELLDLLVRPLPRVPAGEIEPFVAEFLGRARIPLRFETARLPVDRVPPEARLLLGDDGGVLVASVRFAYDDAEVERGGPAVVMLDDGRYVQRDPTFERDALARLDGIWPGTPLRGEAAYDFLLDDLPRLEGWTVLLDPTLRLHRPRGSLSAAVRFKDGTDWFDLRVGFEVDGLNVPPSAVLATWRAGRRYVPLDDGTLARLPEEWLARHGDAVEELAELHKARRGKLAAYAAPLASGLLQELGKREGKAVRRWQEAASRIQAFDRVPDRPLPPGVTATLRDYQFAGYRWMAALRDLGMGGVLADDMGLGKTLQTLVLLADVHRTAGPPSLVVAPTSVVHNWVAEARRFVPELKVVLFHGASREDLPDDADVVVSSYALMRLDDRLNRRWRYAVLDEAQHIKNPQSQVAQAARALDAAHRLALTGTPLENHLLELWSIFQFLMPGFFGARSTFVQRYVAPIQRGEDEEKADKAMGALQRRLRPFILRRVKSEVAAELPPRTEQVLFCDLDAPQRRLYEQVRETYRDQVLRHVEVAGVERSTIQVLEALTRLRQACCHPALLPFPEARAVKGSAKLEVLWELLDELLDEGHRALVFSQWPSLLKLVAEGLRERGCDHLYLDGSTTKRSDLQARWNDDAGPPVFLISLKAGGTGLNLMGADVVIHLDPWWNPQAEAQASDRAHRIGQTRPVMIYKLVARDTAEERILELQERKRALFEAAVDANRLRVEQLTREDLEAVFGGGEP